MPKYEVGYPYTVWVTVEAEDEWEARHKANLMPLEVNASAENTETLLELNEFDQPRVYEIKE